MIEFGVLWGSKSWFEYGSRMVLNPKLFIWSSIVYTINAVNVVKATNQATLAGAEPTQTLTAGTLTYTLDTAKKQASIQPSGVTYNTGTQKLTVNANCIRARITGSSSGIRILLSRRRAAEHQHRRRDARREPEYRLRGTKDSVDYVERQEPHDPREACQQC